MRRHTHEYKRHPSGTGRTTLFAALEVHTGLVQVGHYRRQRRREFLGFMNGIVAQHPDPFEWTKSAVHPSGLKHTYADLRY